MNPRYPVYVPSKGRADSRKTIRALDKINVPYRVVVEEPEYDTYAKVVDPSKLLVLDAVDQGLHYARNWIWEHALSEGHEMFWQLDDNIGGFFRCNRNLRVPVTSGTIFRVAEEFVERFDNVAQAGFQYYTFVPRRGLYDRPPLIINTRIYSCTLNRSDLPFRYRIFYNDDTDLSLQCLKAGWCTILFQAFLAQKNATMTVKGGLTEHYTEETHGMDRGGRLDMARQLVEMHPDVAKIVYKWGRYQHSVDYKPFRSNKLHYREGYVQPEGFDEHGMVLEKETDAGWVPADPPPEWRRGE